MRQAAFPEERFLPVDIRGTDNEGILKRLQERVSVLAKERQPATA